MSDIEIIPPGTPRPNQTSAGRSSWLDAYKSFLMSPREPMKLKLAPLALLGYLPVNILDEVIPVIGFLDDIPYVLLWVFVIFATLRRINRYR